MVAEDFEEFANKTLWRTGGAVDENPHMESDRRRIGVFAIFIVVAVLAILYLNGSFDTELYRFGLNHYPCMRTLGGGALCGPNVTGTPYGP
jgi:hypothetical protein